MKRPWLPALIVIITLSVSGFYSYTNDPNMVKLGEYQSSSWTWRVTRPWRNAFAYWTRVGLPDDTDFLSGPITIRTWPQYAVKSSQGTMTTTADIHGYAYIPPEFPTSTLQQQNDWFHLDVHESLQILAFLPAHMRNTSDLPPSNFTDSFFGHSVAGAAVKSPDAISPEGNLTGRYGHFTLQTSFDPLTVSSLSTDYLETSISIERDGKTFHQGASVMPISEDGLTIITDIDDVLRDLGIWNFHRAITNIFTGHFRPVEYMPQLFAIWKKVLPETVHFQYTTDAPEVFHEQYVHGIQQHGFPNGTFDFRPMIFREFNETWFPRYWSIARQIQAFPRRRFVLIGDTTTPSLIDTYAKLVKAYPGNIQCVFLRESHNVVEGAGWLHPHLGPMDNVGRYHLFKDKPDLENLGATELLKALSEGFMEGGCEGGGNRRTWHSGEIVTWLHGWWWKFLCVVGGPCKFWWV